MAHSPAHSLASKQPRASLSSTSSAPPDASASKAALFLVLLGAQYGLQPLIARHCTGPAAIKSVVVLSTEGVKIGMAAFMLSLESRASRAEIARSWTLRSSFTSAAVPAALYALQNWLCQIGYQHLDSLTFNLLNQTKTLSAALCLFLFLGRRQSLLQCAALVLLLVSAVLLTVPTSANGGGGGGAATKRLSMQVQGILPVMTASFLSGLSASLSQWALQRQKRNSYLFSLELSLYGILTILLVNATGQSPDSVLIRERGLFAGWSARSWLPIVSNAAGGILVGLVTKYSGGVRKGFALIGGIVLTTLVQSGVEGIALTRQHFAAAVLVAVSTWLHSSYPWKPPPSPIALGTPMPSKPSITSASPQRRAKKE